MRRDITIRMSHMVVITPTISRITHPRPIVRTPRPTTRLLADLSRAATSACGGDTEIIPKADIKVDRIRGSGPGGQNRNKVASCVRVTHLPTGTVVTIDGRDQHKNLQKAMKELDRRVQQLLADELAIRKKARRDHAIHNVETIRTYDYKRGVVKDHRSGREASIKDVVVKGKIELMR